MFRSNILPEAFSRVFQPLPSEPIWDWADHEVWLVSQSAAEAGLYRSAKTPWTRRVQELARELVMPCWDWRVSQWIWVPLTEYSAQKSSQSGLSESALNIIRWKAKFQPCNVIYAIDTREEAKNITERLIPSLRSIDPRIFTGDDDDVGTMVARLKDMIIWFMGSFSSGKFANKQAPLRIIDEAEEHGLAATIWDLASRGKTSDSGFQMNLSKPKLVGGPINKAFLRGNQEHFFFPCPHCRHLQWPSFFEQEVEALFDFQHLMEVIHPITGRTVLLPTPYPPGESRRITTSSVSFATCKNPFGAWDELRILDEAFLQCGSCKGAIDEPMKRHLISESIWLPTAHGTPGSVSQHVSDLFSSDRASRIGQIVLDWLNSKKEGSAAIQKFYNHRLGLAYAEEVNKTTSGDIRNNIAGSGEGDSCPPYSRGTIPFVPRALILGGDVGGNYAKWALGALFENLEDIAIIDWGEEIDPSSVADLINGKTWAGPDGKPYRISAGFIDAKFRKNDVYKACLAVPGHRLIPTAGIGGAAARAGKAWAYHQVSTYKRSLKELTYNDRDAKDELYISRIKKKRTRIFFPLDVEQDPEFVAELCAEELIRGENGVTKWDDNPGANHYGDCVKDIVTGFRFLTRQQQVVTEKALLTSSPT